MSGRKHSLADKTLDRFAFYTTFLQYIRPGVLLAHRLSALTPKCGGVHRVSQVFCDDRIHSCFGGAIRWPLSLIQQG